MNNEHTGEHISRTTTSWIMRLKGSVLGQTGQMINKTITKDMKPLRLRTCKTVRKEGK